MAAKLTPMMAQYNEIKQKNPGVILLFRVGDFYETFYEDAKLVSKELNIVLTSRDNIPLAGVPHHAVDAYLNRLVKKGYKVAICEQVEDPKLAKGLVKREVIRVITPGTVLEDSILSEKSNNFLMALTEQNNRYGVAFVDISTGEFLTTQLEGERTLEKLATEVAKFKPSEAVLPSVLLENAKLKELLTLQNVFITQYESQYFDYEHACQKLSQYFKSISCEGLQLATSAAGAVLSYLEETQKHALSYIDKLNTYFSSQYLVLDSTTTRNLELVQNVRDGTSKNTLIELLDKTLTPMGARLLRRWLLHPLVDRNKIIKRQLAVEVLTQDLFLRKDLQELLSKIKDLERLSTKLCYGSATPKELVSLKFSLQPVEKIAGLLDELKKKPIEIGRLKEVEEQLDPLQDVIELIENSIVAQPPAQVRDGNIIKPGYDSRLDELMAKLKEGKDWIATLEARERRRTGIKSLKVGYNQIFGYYIEVSKSNLRLVPQDYLRKQTLASAERFATQELKEKEAFLITAAERAKVLEYELFQKVREGLAAKSERIGKTAKALSELDVLQSFAEVASNNAYVKPEIREDSVIKITDGRHPVVEHSLAHGFVPNDTLLDCANHRLSIITGPNMAGKSTYLRQVALITLLAQLGSFVPAKYASIGIVDRIFTRVGAFDDLVRGQSTFMVEMSEVASILRNATSKSLILLDEIGRGTSTFDGLSIAWAVAEYIHSKKIGAKTLFATHYHHLTELAEVLPGVVNYNIAAKEEKNQIIFLRKLVPGGTNKSYGVQVAQLADLPSQVINRANELLKKLEAESMIDVVGAKKKVTKKIPFHRYTQLILPADLAEERSQLIKELKELDVTKLTPLEALVKLNELKKKVEQE